MENIEKGKTPDSMNAARTSVLKAHPGNRSRLVSMLVSVQEQEAFLSPEAIRRIAEHTGLTDNEVYSFAGFYPWFRFSPEPGHGSKKASIPADRIQAPEDSSADVEKAAATKTKAAPRFDSEMGQVRVITRHFGSINPEKIEDYILQGGYSGLDRALTAPPGEVEAIVTRSGLMEEGSHNLSCGQRWRHCRRSPEKEKILIGHAAGDDPVSMIECALLENDPHGVLEGMLIAAYAAGACRGILYIDVRRPLAISRVGKALDQMQASGYLGNAILESGFSFHVEIIPAPGPLPCGEAGRVIPAIEGRRPGDCAGQDRLHGHPAVTHSVETLARVSAILIKGADWYAGLGRNGYKGTRMVTLTGCVRRPGPAELPSGTSLREIIDDTGGGICDDKTFKAVQVGGPTGGWLSADDLDIPLDGHALDAAGTRFGSGTLLVVAGDACAVDLAGRALSFANRQSCGHCIFCREGTRQMSEILHDIIQGKSRPDDLQLLQELSEGLKLGARCSLGRTASDAFLTTLERFREEYEIHIRENRCLTGFCWKSGEEAGGPNRKKQDGK